MCNLVMLNKHLLCDKLLVYDTWMSQYCQIIVCKISNLIFFPTISVKTMPLLTVIKINMSIHCKDWVFCSE